MSPFHGFWQSIGNTPVANMDIRAAALSAPVTVIYDERGVPHIFAASDHDLYFAQGFVTARDRLWQVDFQARAAAGRLSEIIGPSGLAFDRSQRRMGIIEGAETTAQSIQEDPITAAALQAYIDGFNAWMERLPRRKRPVEYKILGMEPEPLTLKRSALIMMSLSQTLTTSTVAHSRSNARALLDPETYEALYPRNLPWVEPMVPPEVEWDFDPVEPRRPEGGFVPRIVRDLLTPGQPPGGGSNSWAVDGTKTRDGNPLLASDPHLGLALPSIWYEVQLHGPGVNTYGVSLPGAPGVVIGFNEFCAWGITAGTSATLDVLEIELSDERPGAYRHDGEWKPLRFREERIRVRGGADVLEVVAYTHHGPIAQPPEEDVLPKPFPRGHAIQWTGVRPGNTLRAVFEYNRATSHEAFETALRHIRNVNLNFIYADREGTIASGHYGELPVRFPGQGETIGDGSDPAYDWDRFIPFEHLPRVVNPERGFVSSANQTPVAPEYPYYLGSSYANFTRPNRINDLLRGAGALRVEDFAAFLLDNHSLLAAKLLPFLLERLDTDALSPVQQSFLNALETWNGHYDADSRVAFFFAHWQAELRRRLFSPLKDLADEAFLVLPDPSVVAQQLLNGSHHSSQEEMSSIVTGSFLDVWKTVSLRVGEDPEQWHYGRDREFSILHLARLPGFGSEQIVTGGNPESLNAIGRVFAPSWRMIVELTPEGPRAVGHYPGGQTGNPAHPGFDAFIGDWARGELYPLHFWHSPEEGEDHTQATFTLSPN